MTQPRTSTPSGRRPPPRRAWLPAGLRPRGRGWGAAAAGARLARDQAVFWRVIAPLAAAGFEVIVPDLRGFGDSEVGSGGRLRRRGRPQPRPPLARRHAGPRAGGAGRRRPRRSGVAGHGAALRARPPSGWSSSTAPLPYDREAMAGLRTRPLAGSGDYFIRQAVDADGLAAELATPEARRRYIATFYTSRFWAHAGAVPREGTLPVPSVVGPPWTSTPSRSPMLRCCGPASAPTERGGRRRPLRAARAGDQPEHRGADPVRHRATT